MYMLLRAAAVRFFTVVLWVLLASWASADGVYVPLGEPVKLGIPYQQAVVAFRNGEETMVVRSALSAPPGDYAWIIPVPSAPKRIVGVDDSPLDMLHVDFRPAPLDPPLNAGPCGYVVGWFGIMLAIAAALMRRPIVLACAVPCMAIFLLGVYLTTGPRPPTDATAAGIQTLSDGMAGQYHVQVVRGNDGQELVSWLRKQNGGLSPRATQIAKHAASQGWCFIVAKLKNKGKEPAYPHALAITFPTPKPIYPMQLTGTMPGKLLLELVVIADGTAAVHPLCRIISNHGGLGFWMLDSDGHVIDDKKKVNLDWPHCVATFLRAELTPADMTRDYTIEINRFQEIKRRVSTIDEFMPLVRRTTFAWVGIAIGLVGLGLCRSKAIWIGKVAALVLVGLLAGGAYQAYALHSVEKIESTLYMGRD